MAVPVRSNQNVWNTAPAVMCQIHSVPVTIWTDYAIWCDSHGSFIAWDQTSNFMQATNE